MKKIAVIGSGIAGMSAAYFLHRDCELTVYEKEARIGGHTNTVDVHDGEKLCPLDTGFMVFNEHTYPYLTKLFKEIKVDYVNTDMSFSVHHAEDGMEYNGSSLAGLFAQKRNIFNPYFLNMLREINLFNKKAVQLVQQKEFQNLTIQQFVDKLGLSQYFMDRFLVPMSSAVWSTPPEKMKDFPAHTLIHFFYNHGFLGLDTQFQWKTVKGGSRQYRDKIIETYKKNIRSGDEVIEVTQFPDKVVVRSKNGLESYDQVVIASHADEALKMLANSTSIQRTLLSPFKYQENVAVVHSDESVMPKLRKNWSSWNYTLREKEIYTTYYMNSLQGVSDKKHFFVNINGERFIDPKTIQHRLVYHHPLFDLPAITAQSQLDQLNADESRVKFCGSYFRYGFHEDALWSSVQLCQKMLGREVLP